MTLVVAVLCGKRISNADHIKALWMTAFRDGELLRHIYWFSGLLHPVVGWFDYHRF
jgi:hypothetical protein